MSDLDRAIHRERETHDALREALRAAALANVDRVIAEIHAEGDEHDGPEALAHYTKQRQWVERGVLLDYVTVCAFDGGDPTGYSQIVMRTDGQSPVYRAAGLLNTALQDLLDG